MKKVLLVITGLFLGFSLLAQNVARESGPVYGETNTTVQAKDGEVIFFEGFEPGNNTGALPEGWTQAKADNALGNDLMDIVEADQQWYTYSQLWDMGYEGGFKPEYVRTGEAAMHINWNVEAEENVYAITPEITLPEGTTTLEFWMIFPDSYPALLDILLELDGTWEVLAEYNSTNDGNMYDSPVEIDLTGKVGTGRIAFVYKWNDGIQMTIDDISIYNGPTSVGQNELSNLSAYPNPFTNHISVSSNVERVVVYNLIGQEVLNVRNTNSKIITSDLSSGVYVVSFEGMNGERAIRKMIKQ